MAMPKQGTDMAAEYRLYFDKMITEDAKVAFLKMLKERRDKNGDAMCATLLIELGQRWLTDKWVA